MVDRNGEQQKREQKQRSRSQSECAIRKSNAWSPLKERYVTTFPPSFLPALESLRIRHPVVQVAMALPLAEVDPTWLVLRERVGREKVLSWSPSFFHV